MTQNAPVSRVLALVFTDLADSTALKTERGDDVVRDLITRHRAHVLQLAEECSGRIVDWAGDGCFLTFETSSAATMFALWLQKVHADEKQLPGVRVGAHLGEISESAGPDNAPRIEGLAVDIAARISGLAKPGQILMSSAVYDSARQRLGVDSFGEPILWHAHGSYRLKGFDKALEIGEAGLEGVAPMQAPKASDKARRTRRKPGWVFGGESPSDVTARFRLYGHILLGLSVAVLYVGLQFGVLLETLGFLTSAACAGFVMVMISGRAFKRIKGDGDTTEFLNRLRRGSRRSIQLGFLLILIGALISTLANWVTLYIMAMIGIPFCAIGATQLLFVHRMKQVRIPAESAEISDGS